MISLNKVNMLKKSIRKYSPEWRWSHLSRGRIPVFAWQLQQARRRFFFFLAEVISRQTAFSQFCDALGGFFFPDPHLAS